MKKWTLNFHPLADRFIEAANLPDVLWPGQQLLNEIKCKALGLKLSYVVKALQTPIIVLSLST